MIPALGATRLVDFRLSGNTKARTSVHFWGVGLLVKIFTIDGYDLLSRLLVTIYEHGVLDGW